LVEVGAELKRPVGSALDADPGYVGCAVAVANGIRAAEFATGGTTDGHRSGRTPAREPEGHEGTDRNNADP
jgi:hypothetical protein